MGTRIDVAAVPKPIDVGPEMEALERFFRPCTWEGTIHEGGMGPGTPTMRGVGVASSSRSKVAGGSLATSNRISSSRTARSC